MTGFVEGTQTLDQLILSLKDRSIYQIFLKFFTYTIYAKKNIYY